MTPKRSKLFQHFEDHGTLPCKAEFWGKIPVIYLFVLCVCVLLLFYTVVYAPRRWRMSTAATSRVTISTWNTSRLCLNVFLEKM